MKPLVHRSLSLIVSASIVLGGLPAPLLAAQADVKVDAAKALSEMRKWGVYKEGDVLESYLGDEAELTSIGLNLYLTLSQRYNPAEDVEGMKPTLDRLREAGRYDSRRAGNVARVRKQFEEKIGRVAEASSRTEESFMRGAELEAQMTGAAINDPGAASFSTTQTKDGYEYWDAKGLAYRINRSSATTYSRDLQKMQRQMNLTRPRQVAFIPENGLYSPEMFDYAYCRIKNQYDDLVEGMRRDRIMAIAQLLGEANKYRQDMWFNDRSLEAELLAKARVKTFRHRGEDYNIFEMVNKKFDDRRKDLEGSLQGVQRYERDMRAMKEKLKGNPVVTDAQAQTLQLDEQYSMRYLSLGVLETQAHFVRNLSGSLDPTSSDSEQVMKAINESNLSSDQKASYKIRAREMIERLKALNRVLERTRDALLAADYAGSLEIANSALTSSQRELGEISADYTLFVEAISMGTLARQQTKLNAFDLGSKLMRNGYRGLLPSSEYAQAMTELEANSGKFDDIAKSIASGEMGKARKDMIEMNPDAMRDSFEAAFAGEQQRITDAARLSASLKVNRDRVGKVFETNKWLDTVGNYINWTVSLALLAPVARVTLNGIATSKLITGAAIFEAKAGAGPLSLLGAWTVRRSAILIGETSLHTAARLQTLDPSRAWVKSGGDTRLGQLMASSVVGRYALASSVRAINAGARQASFTGLSGGISGAFTLGKHLWDASGLPLGGRSMFSEDWEGAYEALSMGFKGGVWWANESWHPALGYAGLPSTAFRGTKWAGAMDVVGARGVFGTGADALKWSLRKAKIMAPVVEGAALKPGLLEKLSTLGPLGKGSAFTFSMADNVAKYALFSEAAGWVGRKYGYGYHDAPLVGNVGSYGGEDDVEKRIKGANAVSQKWEQAPLWIAIPTFAAHQARDASMYMRAREGVEQYDKYGRTHEYANAKEGDQLRFITRPKIPFSQRIFETSYLSDTAGDYWVVSKDVRRAGTQKEMLSSLGGEKAKPADINPMRFYEATKLGDGKKFINLWVNDEVRLVAHQNFVEALIANPVRTKKILTAQVGTKVEGFGRVTPEVQKDVAVALYSSQPQTGKAMPKELAGRVNEILKPYLEANEMVKPYAKGFIEAVSKAPLNKDFNAVLDGMLKETKAWKDAGHGEQVKDYLPLVKKFREEASSLKGSGKISAAEGEIVAKMCDYIEALNRRFYSFNKVEKTRSLAVQTLESLRTEFSDIGGRKEPLEIVASFTKNVEDWASRHGKNDVVAGPRAGELDSFEAMTKGMGKELEAARTKLTTGEFETLKAAVDEMTASPWVLHDSKGQALWDWRPEQFEAFMVSLTAWAEQGRGGESVRIFQMLKTGGGKTFVSFEGLLPLVEADAAAKNKKTVFLTVQSNLEAQARMEFIAYKKIGSQLTFDTYEGFKTKIAEGKTKGHNAVEDYWILADEMDGAALQPALTIGEVSGRVSKNDPAYNRMEEIDTGLSTSIDRIRNGQASKALTEVRRALNSLSKLEGPKAEAARAEANSLELRTEEASRARGPQARHAATQEALASAGRLKNLLDAIPSSEADAVQSARQSLGRFQEALTAAPPEAPKTWGSRFKDFKQAMREGEISKRPNEGPNADLAADMQSSFKRQQHLLELSGSEAGLTRLAQEAHKEALLLEARAARLEREAKAAEASKVPGSSEKGVVLREELALVGRELEMTRRFEAEPAGRRLANLQERIAGAEAEGSSAQKIPGWKSEAARLEKSLSAERQATASEHASVLRKIHEIGRDIVRVDDLIALADKKGRPAEKLKTLRAALESDYSTRRGEAQRLKAQLYATNPAADLGGMFGRLESLAAEEAQLAGKVESAKIRGERAGPEAGRLAEVRAERKTLLSRTQSEVRSLLKASADEIVAVVREGEPGWADQATRLMERRRQLLKSFAADENPTYTAFREMKEDMQAYAMIERLKLDKPEAYKPAVEALKRRLEGKSLLQVLSPWQRVLTLESKTAPAEVGDFYPGTKTHIPKGRAPEALTYKIEFGTPPLLKLLKQVFRGEKVDVNIDTVGLTRLHAAKLLKALFEDPAMAAHQRDNLFWNFTSSLLRPTSGPEGRNRSWVHTELTRLYQGFQEKIEKPGDIRLDGLTKRVNVVHNGQWFEAMDNEGRRFWELEYGVDLTLPYTHQSISTIKDVTTNKKANFISFSGTLGKKLRNKFEETMKVGGTGSTAPGHVEMDAVTGGTRRLTRITEAMAESTASRGEVLLRSLDGAPEGVRKTIEAKIGGPLKEPKILRLSDFSGPGVVEARAWLSGLRRVQGDADHVVLPKGSAVPTEIKPAIDAYLAQRGLDPKGSAVLRISEVKSEPAQAWLRDLRASQADSVTLMKGDAIPAEHKSAVSAYLKSRGITSYESLNVRIEDVVVKDDAVRTQAVQKWLREGLRPPHKDSSLVVLSVSDTRVLKTIRKYLLRTGVQADEISMVFSDAEYLRINVPRARVEQQMNLDALKTGKARILILDTRVGGRGLDLPFKSGGYTNFKMIMLDPHLMSQVHLLQAQGRIDLGRVLAGASREFFLLMDVGSVQGERVFREMIKTDPFFEQRRSDPIFQKYAAERGVKDPDWTFYHEYMRERLRNPRLEPAVTEEVARAHARELASQYQDVVKHHLELQQAEVELNQLRGASVETDVARSPGRYPGVEGIR